LNSAFITSYERDNETDLDFAQERYYSNKLGRFSSADPIPMTTQRPSDPQRLNLYAYVRNSPLIATDKNGLDLTFEYQYDNDGKITNMAEAKQYRESLEKASGLKLNLDEKTGKITINEAPETLSKVGTKLKAIIDPGSDIRIGSTNNNPWVLGDSFDGAGHQTIDFADVKQMAKGEGFTAESMIIHATVEAYEGRNAPAGSITPPKDAHNTAIDYENEVRTLQMKPLRVKNSSLEGVVINEKKNTSVTTVDFTTHTEKITRDSSGKITEVKVEKKK
jgi:RHS repeat-associated protein